MFIKKDLRKIPTILADAVTDEAEMETETRDEQKRLLLTDLPLQRRKAEFQGSIKILCQPKNAPAMLKLKSLSLYDCEIQDITGIGLCPNLISLNVGRNPIKDLPTADFEELSALESLCMDDCQLQGRLPDAITCLFNLTELRMANNQITEIPDQIRNLRQLTVLGLDNNRLAVLPDAVTELLNLQTLLLRSNQLTALPEDLPIRMISLKLLHVSSNLLTHLPDSLAECTSLTHVYANSNPMTKLPLAIETLPDLKHLNVAHCQIEHLTVDFFRTFGTPNADGVCSGSSSSHCRVLLTGNPVLKQPPLLLSQKEEEDVDMDGAHEV